MTVPQHGRESNVAEGRQALLGDDRLRTEKGLSDNIGMGTAFEVRIGRTPSVGEVREAPVVGGGVGVN